MTMFFIGKLALLLPLSELRDNWLYAWKDSIDEQGSFLNLVVDISAPMCSIIYVLGIRGFVLLELLTNVS